MVANDRSYEDQSRRLLAETLAELNALEPQIEELQNKRAMLKAEAQAYEVAIAGYRRRAGKEEQAEVDWKKLLEGQSHKVKLVTLAKHYGGRIVAKQAVDLLYTKGFMRSKSRANAYIVVQHLLSAMVEDGTFERGAPGEYKLLGSQGSLLTTSSP